MKKTKQFLAHLAVGTAWAGMALSASAAMEMFTADYGSAGSPLQLDASETLSLNKFDTSLGTLEGVTVDLLSQNSVQTEIFNYTSDGLPYSAASTTVPVSVTALNGLSTSTSASAGPFSGVVPAMSMVVDGGSSPIAATSSAAVSPGDLSLYESAGPQTFDVSVLVGDPFVQGSGARLAFEGLGNSYGSVEVIYSYAAVPEPPAAWAGLAATVCCGLAAVRQIRRNQV
jgi:hypothetical protein